METHIALTSNFFLLEEINACTTLHFTLSIIYHL